jgi:hypothetical protein
MATSIASFSGEEGGNFLVQMISTCLTTRRRWGEGGRHPVVARRLRIEPVPFLFVLWPCLYLSAHSGDEDYGCHAGEEQDKPHYHTG